MKEHKTTVEYRQKKYSIENCTNNCPQCIKQLTDMYESLQVFQALIFLKEAQTDAEEYNGRKKNKKLTPETLWQPNCNIYGTFGKERYCSHQ